MPESTPVVGEIVMPAGGVPDEMLHVTGAPAPVCENVTGPYGTVAIASGTVVGVTVIAGHEMVSVALTLPLQPSASVAVTVKVNVPACVGVPERTPVGPSVRGGGGAPADIEKVCGAVPPVAAKAWEYGVPMGRSGSAPAGVTVIAWHPTVSVKACVTGVAVPLVAVNVSG